MFQGIEHTAIASPAPKELAQWYVENLGFRINYDYDGNFFVRAANGTMLEIIPSQGQRAVSAMRDPGIRHLAIAVDDFDASLAELKSRKVNFLTEPYENARHYQCGLCNPPARAGKSKSAGALMLH